MASFQIHYKQTKGYKYEINQCLKKDENTPFRNKDIFVRYYKNYIKLKIRTRKKYPFKRIKLFKKTKGNFWIGTIPNSEDLLILERINRYDLRIIIHIGESKHLTLFATM